MTTSTTSERRVVTEAGSWGSGTKVMTTKWTVTVTVTEGSGGEEVGRAEASRTGLGMAVPKLCMGKYPCWESSAAGCGVAWIMWVVVGGVLGLFVAVLGL